MGKTMAEKIFERKVGKPVHPGDIVVAPVDWAMGQDGTTPLAIQAFGEMNGQQVLQPERVVFVIDHNAPSPLEAVSRLHDLMRSFARRFGVQVFEVGEGVCHELMMSRGLVVPGDLVVGADSHTCTYGALGAFSTGIGSTEFAVVMMTGKLWFKVPESLCVRLLGALPPGVYAKDVILHLAALLGADGATYQAIEFHGPVVKSLSVEERATITNMAVEVGAKAGMVPPDEKTVEWVKKRTSRSFEPVLPDADARYARVLEIDCSHLVPQVAFPHRVDSAKPVHEAEGVPIQEAFVGTCTNGRIPDLEVVAKILRGRRVHPEVRFIVAPASKETLLFALERGWVEDIVRAGGVLVPPGCGPCVGTHQGIPGDGWNIVSTANRNFRGRMGNRESSIYLASPATVAASAIEGKITDPRKYLG